MLGTVMKLNTLVTNLERDSQTRPLSLAIHHALQDSIDGLIIAPSSRCILKGEQQQHWEYLNSWTKLAGHFFKTTENRDARL